MKILATFDGSPFSEVILPHLVAMAGIDGVEFILLSVVTGGAEEAAQHPQQDLREAVERYLRELACRLPVGPRYAIVACTGDDSASTIIDRALRERADVIVMATHGRTGTLEDIFGGVAEQVVRSHVAPVLLVHPDSLRSEWRCVMAPGTTRRSGVSF